MKLLYDKLQDERLGRYITKNWRKVWGHTWWVIINVQVQRPYYLFKKANLKKNGEARHTI